MTLLCARWKTQCTAEETANKEWRWPDVNQNARCGGAGRHVQMREQGNTRTERTREKKRGRERKREAERHGERVASSFPASRDDEQRALCFDEGCLAAAGGCNPGLFIGRKRETKETEDTRHVVLLRRAREHFRTDNVDPIENANASCLKAIDCFSSNTSETAAPYSLLFPRPHFLPRSTPLLLLTSRRRKVCR